MPGMIIHIVRMRVHGLEVLCSKPRFFFPIAVRIRSDFVSYDILGVHNENELPAVRRHYLFSTSACEKNASDAPTEITHLNSSLKRIRQSQHAFTHINT